MSMLYFYSTIFKEQTDSHIVGHAYKFPCDASISFTRTWCNKFYNDRKEADKLNEECTSISLKRKDYNKNESHVVCFSISSIDDNYELYEVYKDDEDITESFKKANNIKFSDRKDINKDIRITLYFKFKIQVKTSINRELVTNITPYNISPRSVNYGGSCTIMNLSGSKYSFEGFYKDLALKESSNIYTISNITEPIQITARYKSKCKVDAITYGADGVSASKEPDEEYYEIGTDVTLSASQPTTGYNFNGWYQLCDD